MTSPSFQANCRWFDTRLLLLGLLLLPALVMGLLWWSVHGSVLEYDRVGAPDGQSLYVLSKLAGLVAIVLIGAQICTGLLRRLGVMPRLSADAARGHLILGSVAIALVTTHVVLFFIAASIRSESVAWSLLLPKPFSGYYELGLSLGLFALAALFAILLSGLARSYIVRAAQIVHRLALPAFGLLLAHAWMIGSDSRYLSSLVVMGSIVLFMTVLLAARIIVLRNRRRSRSGG